MPTPEDELRAILRKATFTERAALLSFMTAAFMAAPHRRHHEHALAGWLLRMVPPVSQKIILETFKAAIENGLLHGSELTNKSPKEGPKED